MRCSSSERQLYRTRHLRLRDPAPKEANGEVQPVHPRLAKKNMRCHRSEGTIRASLTILSRFRFRIYQAEDPKPFEFLTCRRGLEYYASSPAKVLGWHILEDEIAKNGQRRTPSRSTTTLPVDKDFDPCLTASVNNCWLMSTISAERS